MSGRNLDRVNHGILALVMAYSVEAALEDVLAVG
jgi:hypothetical protein